MLEEPLFPFASVALTVTRNAPLVAYVVLKFAPDPVDGEPLRDAQLKVNGATPPEAVAVKAIGEPALPKLGPLIRGTTLGTEVRVKLPELGL